MTMVSERAMKSVPLEKVPYVAISLPELTKLDFDPQEGFVLSRIKRAV